MIDDREKPALEGEKSNAGNGSFVVQSSLLKIDPVIIRQVQRRLDEQSVLTSPKNL